MLHFAYGSNMHTERMRERAPGAVALGIAALAGWRTIVTRDGYASIVPLSGGKVHGVLWRITARDLAALNAYEDIDSGLYRRRILPVRHSGRLRPALAFIGRTRAEGTPRPGFQHEVVEAAQEWKLPTSYVVALSRWLPGFMGARAIGSGEAG